MHTAKDHLKISLQIIIFFVLPIFSLIVLGQDGLPSAGELALRYAKNPNSLDNLLEFAIKDCFVKRNQIPEKNNYFITPKENSYLEGNNIKNIWFDGNCENPSFEYESISVGSIGKSIGYTLRGEEPRGYCGFNPKMRTADDFRYPPVENLDTFNLYDTADKSCYYSYYKFYQKLDNHWYIYQDAHNQAAYDDDYFPTYRTTLYHLLLVIPYFAYVVLYLRGYAYFKEHKASLFFLFLFFVSVFFLFNPNYCLNPWNLKCYFDGSKNDVLSFFSLFAAASLILLVLPTWIKNKYLKIIAYIPFCLVIILVFVSSAILAMILLLQFADQIASS